MVKIDKIIYPRFDIEIYNELKSNGITEFISFGKTFVNDTRVLGKGKQGVIALLDDKKVIKVRRTDSPKNNMELEAKLQMKAYPASPKVFSFGKNFIIMEYINGEHLRNKCIPLDLLFKARYLEENHIQHMEISRPWKNVLIFEKRAYIIDYDSASIRERAFNVNKILSAFRMYDFAYLYKTNKISFDELISILGHKRSLCSFP
ncbi:serine/threonine protein kinase [Acidianus sp. RZ1]|uniref:serine/threonine protein kinase n=1 Tax=Acidianus sp. RZ1 TaxID=1540082 RepID=UPI0014916331|nr:serine/threonine protein kinase [Acidianus sp. RZ1]NON62169.1 serine/threonine protein kinase [Acidianus sp. RZ1]